MPAPISMRIPPPTSKARLALFGLVPVLILGLALFIALRVEYVALGQPALAFFSFNITSGCQHQVCDAALASYSLIEPHTMDKYAQISRLINLSSWHWHIQLGPVILHSDFGYDVPNYEVLVHGGRVDVLGPSIGIGLASPGNQAAFTHNVPLLTLDYRGR